MTVGQRPDGADTAESTLAGQTFRAVSRNGATMVLARQLVAAGAPDDPWQACGVDGAVRLHGPSLHGLAKLTVIERDRGLSVERFTPRAESAVRVRGDAPDGSDAMDGTDAAAEPVEPLAA